MSPATLPHDEQCQRSLFNGFDGEVLLENRAFPNVELQWLLSCPLGHPRTDLVSSQLYKIAGTEFDRRANSALADGRAIAVALAAWRRVRIL